MPASSCSSWPCLFDWFYMKDHRFFCLFKATNSIKIRLNKSAHKKPTLTIACNMSPVNMFQPIETTMITNATKLYLLIYCLLSSLFFLISLFTTFPTIAINPKTTTIPKNVIVISRKRKIFTNKSINIYITSLIAYPMKIPIAKHAPALTIVNAVIYSTPKTNFLKFSKYRTCCHK